ncbi:MAG: hypothetical protein ABIP19_12500 [Dermatophilaceae bacterium]
MSGSIVSTPIYFEAISEWLAVHQGSLPGVVPRSGESKDDTSMLW